MKALKYWYYRGSFPLHAILTFFPFMRRSQSCPNFKNIH